MQDTIPRLIELQRQLRDAVCTTMRSQASHSLSRSVRDDTGDTIFALDIAAEDVLVPFCEEWGKEQPFILIAEGLEADRIFGQPGASGPEFRLIVDPIDGTRGLMYDKRSAWCLAGTAPDKGPETRLSDIEHAVMTELPTTRQHLSDRLVATRGKGVRGTRENILTGEVEHLDVVPTQATDLKHGFATVVNFFQGGKEITSRFEEELLRIERGGWNHHKAEIYTDQYISSGGQLAELALGRDRFVIDMRPLVHRVLGFDSTLCCRPYDLCTSLIAQEAGCIITSADGTPLDSPLDVTTNLSFAGYANQTLAERLAPIVTKLLREMGLK